MCGVPYHAAATYVARLLAAGRKVADLRADDPAGQGPGGREVVEVITPGTVLDDSLPRPGANNYLLAVGRVGDSIGLAYADLSTGEFAATSFPSARARSELREELQRLAPREVIVQESLLAE